MESVFSAAGRLVELEQPEFNRSFREKGVVVGHVIAAVVVVVRSAVFRPVCSVPDVRKLCHGGGLFSVQLFDEIRVDGSAVATHPVLVEVQGIRKQPLVACHDVGKVSQALRCVSACSNVNVYPSPYTCVANRSGFSQPTHQFLQLLDVCVG